VADELRRCHEETGRVSTQEIDAVLEYHELTKHRLRRYAPGPGRLDWATQPDPWRRFAGAPSTLLPFATKPTGTFRSLFSSSEPRALDLDSLAIFLELSLSVSAWKQFADSKWALRTNPSSGNLHPTEAYVLAPAIAALSDRPALHHYRSDEHLLERRAELDDEAWRLLLPDVPEPRSRAMFLLTFTSIVWREAWKYGERAFRYCQHDVGHALAAVAYAASMLGWTLRLAASASDAMIAHLVGVDRREDYAGVEVEHPDMVCVVDTRAIEDGDPAPRIDASAVDRARWLGRPNRLSARNIDWPGIGRVTQATWSEAPTRGGPALEPKLPPLDAGGSEGDADAASVIHGRRSAVAFDATTHLSRDSFFRLLDSLLPRSIAPFSSFSFEPRVHLGLFVHRVRDLSSGLYLLVRRPDAAQELASMMREEISLDPVEGAPAHLPLYLLGSGDLRQVAALIACHQEIAGDCAVSVAMLAELERTLEESGPSAYRRLFWETGVIGQALYLGAEARALRGTGIGCFFDDEMHELLGIRDHRLQDLYHFALGGAVDDPRITTLPDYARRGSAAS
jgi:SagB-type dehydrogenase family enzyme